MTLRKWLKPNAIQGTEDEVIAALTELAAEVAEHEKQFYFVPETFVEEWLERPNAQLGGLEPTYYLGEPASRGIAAGALVNDLRTLFATGKYR